MRVSERSFPKQNPQSGGTIYTWTLGAGQDRARRRARARPPRRPRRARWPQSGVAAAGRRRHGPATRRRVTQLLATRARRSSRRSRTTIARLADAARDNDRACGAMSCSAPAGRSTLADSTTRPRSTGRPGTATSRWSRTSLRPGAPVDIKGDEYDGTPLPGRSTARCTAGTAGQATTPASSSADCRGARSRRRPAPGVDPSAPSSPDP